MPHPEAPYDLDSITRRLSTGEKLTAIAADYLVDVASLLAWIRADKAREAAYENARRDRAELIVESLETTMEEAMGCRDKVQIQAYRLKIDTLKWFAGKFHPRMYGERQQVEFEDRTPKDDGKLEERLGSILAKALSRAPAAD